MEEVAWKNLFIGREKEIAELQKAWKSVKEGKPAFIVLRGEPGNGKTRVAREFYRWLSTTKENASDYWPKDLDVGEMAINPSPSSFSRKTISIPYLWWGVRCLDPAERNHGERTPCALREKKYHLETHIEAIKYLERKIGRGIKIAKQIGMTIGNPILLGLPETVSNILDMVSTWREEQKEKGMLSESNEVSQKRLIKEDLKSLHESLIEILSIKNKATSTLPIIIFLDDAHWLDEFSLEAVEDLYKEAIEKKLPLMLIATHWEREWLRQESAKQTEASTDSLAFLFRRLNAYKEEESYHGIVDCAPIGSFTKIISFAFPGLTSEQQNFIDRQSAGNPEILNAILQELFKFPSYFEGKDSSRALTDDAMVILKRSSFKLHDIQERRFDGLSENLKQLLTLASFHGMRFLSDLVLEVSRLLDCRKCGSIDLLEESVYPYAILAKDGGSIYEFRSKVEFDVIKSRIEKFPSLQAEVSQCLLLASKKWITEEKYQSLPIQEKRSFFYLLIYKCEKFISLDSQIYQVILTQLFFIDFSLGYLTQANTWSNKLRQILDKCGGLQVGVEEAVKLAAIWHIRGQLESALTLYKSILEDKESESTANVDAEEHLDGIASIQCEISNIYEELGECSAEVDDERIIESAWRSLSLCKFLVSKFGDAPIRLERLALSYCRIGRLLKSEDDSIENIAAYKDGISILRRLILEYGETQKRLKYLLCSLGEVGLLFERKGEVEKVISIYQEKIEIRVKLMKEYSEVRVNRVLLLQEKLKIIEFYLNFKNTEYALAAYHAIIDYTKDLELDGLDFNLTMVLALGYAKIGSSFALNGMFVEAIEAFLSSIYAHEIRIQKGYKIHTDMVEAKLQLANLLLGQGNKEAGISYLASVLSDCEKIEMEYGNKKRVLAFVGDVRKRAKELS